MGPPDFILMALFCLFIAINESNQESILERLKRDSYYREEMRCKEKCEEDCSESTILCGKRTGSYENSPYYIYRTFYSHCHLECYNECPGDDKYEHHSHGECQRHEHDHDHHDHHDYYDRSSEEEHHHSDPKHVVANQDKGTYTHTVIPTCAKAQQCLCSNQCQPICARSPDNPPIYVAFDNICRLTCTNQCFNDSDQYVRTDASMCKNGLRDYTCKYRG